MPTPPEYPVLMGHIASARLWILPGVRHAHVRLRCGHDPAADRRSAAFDHVHYAVKACSNLAILDLIRGGPACRLRQRQRNPPGAGRGLRNRRRSAPIVYTADVFDADGLELCVQKQIHVNCGSSDMIDQLGHSRRASASRCGSIPDSDTVTAKKPIPAESRQNTASGMRKSPIALPGQGDME